MKDARLRIFGQLTINIISLCFFYPSSVLEGNISAVKLIFYVVATTFLVWETLRLSIKLVRKKYPGIAFTRQRLTLVSVITLLIVAITPFVRFFIGDLIDLYGGTAPGSVNIYDYLRIIGQNIFYCLFIAATYEAIYFFQQWKKLSQEASALKKETIMGQFNSLKNQVSPHFLFNTLNTLSTLIRRDSEKAEEFIGEMADVYRYMLRVNEKNLVPLREEIDFILSYAHLLKTRFNNNFKLDIVIDETYMDHLLPPLALQMLVENSIKHNIVSAKYPMTVSIRVEEEKLVVRNTIRKKQEEIVSGKTGLNNIISRYRLLNLSPVDISDTDDTFTVILPLCKVNVYESIDY